MEGNDEDNGQVSFFLFFFLHLLVLNDISKYCI